MGTFTITKLTGGLNRTNPQDYMKSGLVMGGVAAAGLALNTTSDELTKAQDAVELGIDEAYDAANAVLVYYHIKEFFRLCPSGRLRIRLVAQTVTLTQMCDIAETHVKQMIDDANGELRRIGVVRNPAVGYVPTLTGGLDNDVNTAIPKAQEIGVAAFTNKKHLTILIEGREFNGTVLAANNLRSNEAEYARVTIIQDPAVAALDALYAKHAAVGATLGVMALANMHEDIGWTQRFNIQGDNDEFASVALSSGALASTIESSIPVLTGKGYLVGRNYPQVAGVWFDGNPTCADGNSDFAFGQEVDTMNEAARLLYVALFPRINSPVLINPDNGQIAPEVAKEIEADGSQAMNILKRNGNVSGYDVFVDPNQDILTTGILEVKFSIVAVGTARTIEAKIGYVLKLN